MASLLSLLPPTQALRHAEPGLVAAKALSTGAVLLKLPRHYVLSKDSAQETALLDFLDPEDASIAGLPHWAALPDDFVLALQLAHAHYADENATFAWRKWLEVSMARLNSTALWTAGERAWLNGSHCLRRVTAHFARSEHHVKMLLAPLVQHKPAFFRAGAHMDGGGSEFSAARIRELASVVVSHALHPQKSGLPILMPLPQLKLEVYMRGSTCLPA